MRTAFWGSAVIAGLVVLSAIGGLFHHNRAYAQPDRPTDHRPPSELIALSSDGNAAHQQITVIDQKSRVMSVYHVEHATGAITLKSVRNIEADLLMDEFNTDHPLPREIRAMMTNR